MNPHPVRIYGAQGTLGTIEYTEEVNTGLLSSFYICVSQDTVSELMEMSTKHLQEIAGPKEKEPHFIEHLLYARHCVKQITCSCKCVYMRQGCIKLFFFFYNKGN